MEGLGPWPREEGLDDWKMGHGIVGQRYPGCTFCGSLHPDTFMELVEAGAVVGPSDKAYKAYLHAAVDETMVAARKERWKSQRLAQAIRDTGTISGLAEEAIEAEVERHWAEHEEPLVGGLMIGKFYYQHLSEDQKRRFVALHNEGKMAIGHPGHFYVLPFFMVRPK